MQGDSILGFSRLYILKVYQKSVEKKFEDEGEREVTCGGTEKLNLDVWVSLRLFTSLTLYFFHSKSIESSNNLLEFSSVQLLRQGSLSITNSRSLLKLMSIESVIPSNHIILCCPLLLLPSIFPSIRSFPVSQLFASGGQSIGVSASTSVLPMNTQDWSTLGWTGWISLQSKGLSRVFSNTTVQKHQFFQDQLSLWSNSHIHTWLLKKP